MIAVNREEDRMIGLIDAKARRAQQQVREAAQERQAFERHPELPVGATLTVMPVFRPTREYVPERKPRKSALALEIVSGQATVAILDREDDGSIAGEFGNAGQKIGMRRAVGADRFDKRRFPAKGKDAFPVRKHYLRHLNRRLAARA